MAQIAQQLASVVLLRGISVRREETPTPSLPRQRGRELVIAAQPSSPTEEGGCHCERSEAISSPSPLPGLGKW